MFKNLREIIKSKFNSIGNMTSDSGPLSFFSQWFNPNNLVGELEQLEKYTGIVYTCVSAIAEDVAKIKFTVGKPQADGTLKAVQTHPFLTLLKQPNPVQSDYEFIEMTQTHIELAGEAFWYVAVGEVTRKPKELYIMRPDLVQVVYDQESGEVTGYIYHKWNGRVQIPLDLDEVIHFKMPNPINPYRGMGTVQAGIIYIQTEEYASRYSRNYLANNATPAGIVNFKGTVDDIEFNKIKRQWNREYGNVQNAGKTAFLRNVDAEFVKVGSSLADIDLKELKNLTRDDIMTMFRVSKPILGITEDVNYSNAKTAEYVFAKRVIDPKMNRIVDTLQSYFARIYKDTNVLGYQSPIPQDNDEKIAYLTAAVGGTDGVGWMTRNEVRRQEKLPDIPGGDDLLVPFSLVPIAKAESGTGTAPSDSASAGGTKTIMRLKMPQAKKIRLKLAAPKLGIDQKEAYRQQFIRLVDAYAPQLEHQVRDVIAGQKARVLTQLKKHKKRDLSDEINYDTENTAKSMVDQLMPVLMEVMREAGKLGLLIAGADELQFELTQGSINRIQARVEKVAADFGNQTQEQLVAFIKQGLDDGLSLADLSAGIEDIFGQAMGYRAERIARTEAHHEANMAALDAYDQTGYVLKKEWYAGGVDPCQFCEAMNGVTISTEDVFVEKGGTIEGVNGGILVADYGDIETADAHPNCQCTILPVVEHN